MIIYWKVSVIKVHRTGLLQQGEISDTGSNATGGCQGKNPKRYFNLNWFWIDQEKEMELKNFGFKQIYGNFTPNISNWDERIKKIDLAGGAPSSWASTNEFNFGKDLILDFLGCANFVWSSHTIDQTGTCRNCPGLMPSVRSNLSGKGFQVKMGILLNLLIFLQNSTCQKIQKFLILI